MYIQYSYTKTGLIDQRTIVCAQQRVVARCMNSAVETNCVEMLGEATIRGTDRELSCPTVMGWRGGLKRVHT